ALVTTDSLPSIVGDEPSLIVSMTGVPMAVCPNRQQAITTLMQAHPNLQLIIADDGLQHYALQRDIEWIVVDVARGFGSGQLLPTGFLREPMSRLDKATVIYHKKLDNDLKVNSSQSIERLTMHLQPDSLQALWPSLWPSLWSSDANSLCATSQIASVKPLVGSQVHGVSGIGYPQRFFATLEALGFQVSGHSYPDHYDFKLIDLLHYQHYPIIVTSKDAVKIRALLATAFNTIKNDENKQTEFDGVNRAELNELVARLWVLPVSAQLSDACYAKLQWQLKDLGIAIKNATY
ncbi:MAG: tetraacyldisaccharide 4'-kinase, partial [Psychrobacter sp.]|nr:tetraacyldisaccharide 4'-kinase [Psychrobacter sp.]